MLLRRHHSLLEILFCCHCHLLANNHSPPLSYPLSEATNKVLPSHQHFSRYFFVVLYNVSFELSVSFISETKCFSSLTTLQTLHSIYDLFRCCNSTMGNFVFVTELSRLQHGDLPFYMSSIHQASFQSILFIFNTNFLVDHDDRTLSIVYQFYSHYWHGH